MSDNTICCLYPKFQSNFDWRTSRIPSFHLSCSVAFAPRPAIPFSRIRFAGLGLEYLSAANLATGTCDGKEAEMVNWESENQECCKLWCCKYTTHVRDSTAFGPHQHLVVQVSRGSNFLTHWQKTSKKREKSWKPEPGYLETSLNNYLRKPRKPRNMVRIATYDEKKKIH